MSERTFMDKAWDVQRKVDKKWANVTSGKYARVLKMARKPEPEEFRRTSGVVLIGVAVVGGIGFAVYLLMDWIQSLLPV